MKTVAFVTCRELDGIVPDDRLIAVELARRDVAVVPVAWDDGVLPEVDAYVVRSPWNYHLEPDAFVRWLERAAEHAPLFNDLATIRWNMHKQYLDELAAAGVNVVPTAVCRRGEPHDLAVIMRDRQWNEAVVKPAISASSYMTAIVGATPHPALRSGDLESRFMTDGQAHLDAILETRDALVQPFMPEIFTRGERSLIYAAGQYSHCIQKNAFNTGPGAGAATDADDAERAMAERALAVSGADQLYARVDLLRDAHGAEYLMELELLDPELYVRFDPAAPARFADALVRALTP